MNKLTAQELSAEAKLIEYCKSAQGEYLPIHHGPGSWATTYSMLFIDSASVLTMMYERIFSHGYLHALSKIFINNGIESCRKCKMTNQKIKYLYDIHLKKNIKKISNKGLFLHAHAFDMHKELNSPERYTEWLSIVKTAVPQAVFQKVINSRYTLFIADSLGIVDSIEFLQQT